MKVSSTSDFLLTGEHFSADSLGFLQRGSSEPLLNLLGFSMELGVATLSFSTSGLSTEKWNQINAIWAPNLVGEAEITSNCTFIRFPLLSWDSHSLQQNFFAFCGGTWWILSTVVNIRVIPTLIVRVPYAQQIWSFLGVTLLSPALTSRLHREEFIWLSGLKLIAWFKSQANTILCQGTHLM